MPNLKIQALSGELCHLLGVDVSNENAVKVSRIISALVTEISAENTQNDQRMRRQFASNDPHLTQRIGLDSSSQRDVLISNLSALR